MGIWMRAFASATVAAALAAGSTVIAPSAALAVQVTCGDAQTGKTPVITVHGLTGNLESLRLISTRAGEVSGLYGLTFQYANNNRNWVTHPSIGAKLAETIACYRKKSATGKVAIIAHSMGGLAALHASSLKVGGRPVYRQGDLVITMGTPYLGSGMAAVGTGLGHTVCAVGSTGLPPSLRVTQDNCFTSGLGLPDAALEMLAPNSAGLQKLPRGFPDGVAVHAIAGKVSTSITTELGNIGMDYAGDLVVGVDSATKYYTTKHAGDGKTVLKCRAGYVLFWSTDAWCEHSHLPNAPQVQAVVKKALTEWHAEQMAALQPKMTVYGLAISLPNTSKWKVDHKDNHMTVLYDSSRCYPSAETRRGVNCAGMRIRNYKVDPVVQHDGYCLGDYRDLPATKVWSGDNASGSG